MQFSLVAVAALFGASALAAPAPQGTEAPTPSENIDISDFSVRKENGTITNVNFLLTGRDATNLSCVGGNPGFPSDVITCGDSKYRFTLREGSTSEFALRIYHELGLAVGFWGEGDVPSYCHAGGLGALLCAQVAPTTIVINNTPPPVNP